MSNPSKGEELDPATASELLASLGRMGLLAPGERPPLRPLTGGVSSLIVRADTARGPVCVKRALPKLKVAADWFAPVRRNRAEVAWMREAARSAPGAVPAVLAEDREADAFAMPFLDPAGHPVWKAQLLAGRIEAGTAAAVARVLAAIHADTAARPALEGAFRNDADFRALRLDPYLAATAEAHPDLAPALHRLIETTARTRLALIHGDVSPKNILVGPRGPVLLDAECATWGDPAFDLAFCLNHLLLKAAWRPADSDRYGACFAALADGYLAGVAWEAPAALERRAAALLPGLLLARVDGKSPVEYLTEERDRARVRRAARALLMEPPADLRELRRRWEGDATT